MTYALSTQSMSAGKLDDGDVAPASLILGLAASDADTQERRISSIGLHSKLTSLGVRVGLRTRLLGQDRVRTSRSDQLNHFTARSKLLTNR